MGIIDANPATSSSFSPENYFLQDLLYVDEATSKLVPIKSAKELGDLLDSRVGNRIQYGGTGRKIQCAPIQQVAHYATLGDYLRHLYEHDRLMDVGICLDRSTFKAHRVALSCFSGYFADFFDRENIRKVPAEIKLSGVSGVAFAAFLKYVYTGEVVVDLNLTADLLTLAEHLKVESLQRKLRHILGDINLSEAVELLLKSEPKISKGLYDQLLDKVILQFVAASRTAGFFDIDVDTFCNILASEDLEVSREYDVFSVALRWITHGARERLRYAVRVMSLIRFCYMSSEELFDCVTESEMFRSISQLKDLVLTANWTMTCSNLQRADPFGFPVSKPRKSYSANVCMRNANANSDDKYKVEQGLKPTTIDYKYDKAKPTLTPNTEYQKSTENDNQTQEKRNPAESHVTVLTCMNSELLQRSPVCSTLVSDEPKPVLSPRYNQSDLQATEGVDFASWPLPIPKRLRSPRYAKANAIKAGASDPTLIQTPKQKYPTSFSAECVSMPIQTPKSMHSSGYTKPVLPPPPPPNTPVRIAEDKKLEPMSSPRFTKPVLPPQPETPVRISEDEDLEQRSSPRVTKPVFPPPPETPIRIAEAEDRGDREPMSSQMVTQVLPPPPEIPVRIAENKNQEPMFSPKVTKPVFPPPKETPLRIAEGTNHEPMSSPRFTEPEISIKIADDKIQVTLSSPRFATPVLSPPPETCVRIAEDKSQVPLSSPRITKPVLPPPPPAETPVRIAENKNQEPMSFSRLTEPVLRPPTETSVRIVEDKNQEPMSIQRFTKLVLSPQPETSVRIISQVPMSSPRFTKPRLINQTENKTKPTVSPTTKPTRSPRYGKPVLLPPTEHLCDDVTYKAPSTKPVSSPKFAKPVLSQQIDNTSLSSSEDDCSTGRSPVCSYLNPFSQRHGERDLLSMTDANQVPSYTVKSSCTSRKDHTEFSIQAQSSYESIYDNTPSPKPVFSPRDAKAISSPQMETTLLHENYSTLRRSSPMCYEQIPMPSPINGKPVLLSSPESKSISPPKSKTDTFSRCSNPFLLSSTDTFCEFVTNMVSTSTPKVSQRYAEPSVLRQILKHDQRDNASTDSDDQQVCKPGFVQEVRMPHILSSKRINADADVASSETESSGWSSPDSLTEFQIPNFKSAMPSSDLAGYFSVPSSRNEKIHLTGSSEKPLTKTFEIYLIGEFRANLGADLDDNAADEYAADDEVADVNAADDNMSTARYCHLPTPLRYSAVVTVNEKIYILGGCNPVLSKAKALSTVFQMDLRCNKWRALAPMQDARMNHCACVLDNNIYVFGGLDRKNRPLSTVECYNIATNTWIYLPMMPKPRYAAAAACFGRECYVVGGLTEAADGDSVEILNSTISFYPRTNQWRARGKLRVPLCYTSLVNVSDRLMVCGGATSSDMFQDCDNLIVMNGEAPVLSPYLRSVPDIYEYNTGDNSWKHVTTLTIPRHNAGVTVAGSRIYLFGGVNSTTGTFLRSIECYDTGIPGWLESPGCLPYPASWLECVACEK